MRTAISWRESFPDIPWDEPLVITIMDSQGKLVNILACRFCIADIGLKAEDVLRGDPEVAAFHRPDDYIEHMATRHGT